MAEKKARRSLPSALGATTLLVVFAVLCLTVFALLSLSTVQADSRLAQRSREAVEEYYAADTLAQETLARLRRGECPAGVTVAGAVASYTVPISETQELRVEVELDRLLLDMETDGYRVLRWQMAAVEDWSFDESLDLWDGTGF